MQLTYEKLLSQLRRRSRVRKVAAVLLAAYAVKKLSPYVWRRIQVRRRRRLFIRTFALAGDSRCLCYFQRSASGKQLGGANVPVGVVSSSSNTVDKNEEKKKKRDSRCVGTYVNEVAS